MCWCDLIVRFGTVLCDLQRCVWLCGVSLLGRHRLLEDDEVSDEVSDEVFRCSLGLPANTTSMPLLIPAAVDSRIGEFIAKVSLPI